MASAPRRPAWTSALACLAWLGLWYFTPGLLGNGPGSLFTRDWNQALIIECAIAVVVVAVLLLTHRRFNRALFAPSRLRWLYLLPAALALALPFHYGLEAPVGLYVIWMTVSVFWQNYLTFGLLQSYLCERIPAGAAVALVAMMFWLGHLVFIPHRFGLDNILPSLAMIALGALFALLRARLGTLHLLLALHLSFYFALS